MILSLVLIGAVGGVATLSLIAVVHQALSKPVTESLELPALFAGACTLVLLTEVGARWLQIRLSNSTIARLRYELCGRIMTAPLPKLEAVGTHRLTASLGGDVNAITGVLTAFPNVCANLTVLICGLGYLASLSLPVAGCVVLVAGVGTASYLLGLRIAKRYVIQAREDHDEVVKQTRAMVQGIKELKGNRLRCLDFFYGVLLPADTKMRRNAIVGSSIQGLAHSGGRMFLLCGIGTLIFVWPRWYQVSAGTLTGYTLTILYLTHPLGAILGWLPTLNAASIALSKIDRLGLSIDDSEEQTLCTVMPPFESLEFRDVTYGYTSPDGRGFALGPIDLTISSGEELFIAGGNGSGKTTMAKVLTGLYAPDEGRVLLNGQVVTNEIRNNYRQLFSTVFVEGHVFDRLLGIDLDQDQLRHFAGLLEIEKYVDFETGQFSAQKLSRGQHKRLALLVACMDNRPILVFDEWAAEQDPGFKDIFYRQILPELRQQGKTVVAITHDDRYFSAADRVLKLVDGRLDEPARAAAA